MFSFLLNVLLIQLIESQICMLEKGLISPFLLVLCDKSWLSVYLYNKVLIVNCVSISIENLNGFFLHFNWKIKQRHYCLDSDWKIRPSMPSPKSDALATYGLLCYYSSRSIFKSFMWNQKIMCFKKNTSAFWKSGLYPLCL